MGRIVTHVRIGHPLDPEKMIECDALVDTGRPTWSYPRRGEIDWAN